MKELTKREAAMLILGGGMVDCWSEDGEFAGTIKWSDETGFVTKGGDWYRCLNYPKLTEHVPPKSVEIDFWFNVYTWGMGQNYDTRESATKELSLDSSHYINTINIKQTVTEDV